MLLGNPYVLIALVVGWIATAGGAFTGGLRFEAGRWGAAEAKQLEAVAAERQAIEERLAKVSADYEAEKAKSHVVYRTITKEVDRAAAGYGDRSCLDDLGVQLANRALAGAADAGGPPRPVRKPDAAR